MSGLTHEQAHDVLKNISEITRQIPGLESVGICAYHPDDAEHKRWRLEMNIRGSEISQDQRRQINEEFESVAGRAPKEGEIQVNYLSPLARIAKSSEGVRGR